MNKLSITYLNRLSDLLFILARHPQHVALRPVGVPGGERGGQPGAEREE